MEEDEGFFEEREDLTDWELICVISYLHQLFGKVDQEMVEDFENLRDKHFAGSDEKLLDTIENLITHYENEFNDRHKN